MSAVARAELSSVRAGAGDDKSGGGDRIRVVVADDHEVTREGIKSMLAAAPDMVVVGEADNGVEAAEQARTQRADVLILDVQMPRGGGLETLRALRAASSDIAVLILSFHPEAVFAVPFLREGANGYLSKENTLDHLLDAIRRVSGGGRYLSPAAAEHLARRISTLGRPALHDRLSAQELLVLSLLAAGKSPDDAAIELMVSRRALQRCIDRTLLKTGLPNQTALIQYAFAGGIAHPGVAALPPHGL